MIHELKGEAVPELSGETVLELSGEAVHELSGEAVLEFTGEVVHELSGEAVPELSGEVVHELSGEAVLEFSGEAVLEFSSEAVHELSGEAVLKFSGDAFLELSGEAVLELSREAVLELSGEAVLELKFSRHSLKLSTTSLAVSAGQRSNSHGTLLLRHSQEYQIERFLWWLHQREAVGSGCFLASPLHATLYASFHCFILLQCDGCLERGAMAGLPGFASHGRGF